MPWLLFVFISKDSADEVCSRIHLFWSIYKNLSAQKRQHVSSWILKQLQDPSKQTSVNVKQSMQLFYLLGVYGYLWCFSLIHFNSLYSTRWINGHVLACLCFALSEGVLTLHVVFMSAAQFCPIYILRKNVNVVITMLPPFIWTHIE